jgi:hypothetical protein
MVSSDSELGTSGKVKHGNEPWSSIKTGKFIEYLSKY